jgi:phosphomannomutase
LDGVKLILEDGSWLLFRLTGTEPLVRLYAEAATEEHLDRLVTAGEVLFGR